MFTPPGLQGATVFGEREVSIAQSTQTILSNALTLRTAQTAPIAVEDRPYWSGPADESWPYYARFRAIALDHNKQPLRMQDASTHNGKPAGTILFPDETCSCGDETYVNAWGPAAQRYIGGHVHGYRVVCPVCRWCTQVNDERVYPIPVHGGVTNRCSGAYALVQSELFAYPVMAKGEPYDPTPSQWRVYNRWTGKYVANVQGAETPDQDLAYAFPSEADATQFVTQTQGTAVAHARAQPKPEGELPYCGWCNKNFPLGATECDRCLPHAVGQPHEQMVRDAFETNERHWVYVSACNAKGQGVGRSIGF